MSTQLAKTEWNKANQTERQTLAENAGLKLQHFHSWECLDSWQRRKLCFSIEGCGVAEEDRHREGNEATYCPEDNKLRLYIDPFHNDGRVERETFNYLRKLKFKATPKQSCSFVATWSRSAEQACLALIGEGDDIGDEDYSPQERAADRAERFSDYRDKRRSEAGDLATAYESGPSAFGHQSHAKAERAAKRHERKADQALTQWDKAEYWHRRTEGVIANALYKSEPSVRRGRIAEIEKDIRRIEACYTPSGNDSIMQQVYSYSAGEYLYNGEEVKHVWCGKGRGGRWVPECQLEDIKAAYARTLEHLKFRLAYEFQMIGEQGGMAGEVDIVPGGWIRADKRYLHDAEYTDGWAQVQKVNRSPATKRVTSVSVYGYRWYERNREQPPYLITVKIDRAGEDVYRAPTAEELEEFNAKTKKRKAKEKASKPAAPKLINPTDLDAEKLQSIWNAQANAKIDEANKRAGFERYSYPEPSEVWRMTQKEYSARSKGDYGPCKTAFVTENAEIQQKEWVGNSRELNGGQIFKIRKGSKGFTPNAAYRVVVLTDKKQHPIPWEAMEDAKQAAEEAKRAKAEAEGEAEATAAK